MIEELVCFKLRLYIYIIFLLYFLILLQIFLLHYDNNIDDIDDPLLTFWGILV